MKPFATLAYMVAVTIATSCLADVTVTGRSGGPPLVEDTHYEIGQNADGDYIIDIIAYYEDDPFDTNQYFITIGDGDVVQLLQVTVPFTNGSGKHVSLIIRPENGATSGRLDAVTTPTQEPVNLNAHVLGDIGSLDATEIGNIRAIKGNVLGPISAAGSITTVVSEMGSVLADITAGSGGSIGFIEALNGDIGAPGANNHVIIQAGDRINKVFAKNVYADFGSTSNEGCDIARVIALDGVFEGEIIVQNIYDSDGDDDKNGVIRGITGMAADIFTSGDIKEAIEVIGGDFAGSIECDNLTGETGDEERVFSGYINIKENPETGFGGAFVGDVLINSSLSGPLSYARFAKSYEGTFTIGDNFAADENAATTGFDVLGDPSNGEGLKGQVIINANNNSGAWTGAVAVNSTALAPVPYYNNIAADVGGGAVGLVPYYLHYKDCTPIGNKYNETSTGLDQLGECDAGSHALLKISYAQLNPSVTIRHYGPIKQQGTGKPFTVKRISSSAAPCDGMGNPNWIDVTDAVVGGPFTHTLHPNGELRALQVAGPFEDGFDYLIEPKTTGSDMLLCDGLTDPMEVKPVMDYDYRIRVFYLQNTTMSNGLEANDITAWIANPTDTTLDGTADNNDLVDVIEAVTNSND